MLLRKILTYKNDLLSIKLNKKETDYKQPVWNNRFLSGLDIVSLYTIIATEQPKKYLEIGSGNSTKVAYKAKTDHGIEMKIISIDPMPRAEIDELADEVVREPFEKTQRDITKELASGDILFIDNSHRILPNSDSTVFFLDVLPFLKPGVIVHIHDIFLPYDYPEEMCERGYSEQYGLAIYLLANPEKFDIILPNAFVSGDKYLSSILQEFWNDEKLKTVENHGGSFWFKIKD